MQYTLNSRNIKATPRLSKHIKSRLRCSFSRIQDQLDRVTITINDINGPKGGLDKECRLIVKPTGMRELVISEIGENIYQAIDHCLARASHSLIRQLKRKKSLHKKSKRKKIVTETFPLIEEGEPLALHC